jgi:hypothetical protein
MHAWLWSIMEVINYYDSTANATFELLKFSQVQKFSTFELAINLILGIELVILFQEHLNLIFYARYFCLAQNTCTYLSFLCPLSSPLAPLPKSFHRHSWLFKFNVKLSPMYTYMYVCTCKVHVYWLVCLPYVIAVTHTGHHSIGELQVNEEDIQD